MLKILLLQKQRDDKKGILAELQKKMEGFKTREAELEADIQAAQSEEEKQVVGNAVDEFDKERTEAEKQAEDLEKEVADLDRQIAELEEKSRSTEKKAKEKSGEKRKDDFKMNTRKMFFGMTRDAMEAFTKRESVQHFINEVRIIAKEKRSVTGGELSIPDDILGLIRENITEYSKLLKHVNLKTVRGTSRLIVMGTVPEAIWTEATGKLNDLNFSFNQCEVDGYKVAGFVAIPISTVEDSDIDLTYELMVGISQAIGIAIDKAMLYGTGKKMPLGIVTRLAQETEPEDYSANERDWEDLHTSNIQQFDSSAMTGTEFFQKMLSTTAAAKSKYSVKEEPFWAMSRTTYAKIMGFAVATTSAGAFVSSVEKVMPVIRGEIEILDFMPEGDIVGGYGDLYLLVERAGATLKQYDQTLAIEDQLLLIGKARYDGKPVIAEGFVAVNINNSPVTKTLTFTEDSANAAG